MVVGRLPQHRRLLGSAGESVRAAVAVTPTLRAAGRHSQSCRPTPWAGSHDLRDALPLVQDFLSVAEQGRNEIAQDAARASLDLHRYRHARRQIDETIVDLHLRAVERDARALVQLLTLGLAAVVRRPHRSVIRTVQPTVADDRILRDTEHPTMQQAVAREIEGIDLDLRVLPGMYEADVAVRYQGLDLEPAVDRDDNQQSLCRCDDSADCMDGELLHDPVDGRLELLEPGPLLGLDQILHEPVRLLLGFGEIVREGTAIFGLRLASRLAYRGRGCLGLLEMALLDVEFVLLLDQQLEGLIVGQLRAKVLLHQCLADVDAGLNDRDQHLK